MPAIKPLQNHDIIEVPSFGESGVFRLNDIIFIMYKVDPDKDEILMSLASQNSQKSQETFIASGNIEVEEVSPTEFHLWSLSDTDETGLSDLLVMVQISGQTPNITVY